MICNPVRWFEIYVQDMARAKKFYESVLGQALTSLCNPSDPSIEMWSFPMEKDVVGAGGALVKIKGVPSGGNSTIIYFASQDCAVEEARVVKAGGGVHKSKMSIGQYGFISLVLDTEGNMFGLHSME